MLIISWSVGLKGTIKDSLIQLYTRDYIHVDDLFDCVIFIQKK